MSKGYDSIAFIRNIFAGAAFGIWQRDYAAGVAFYLLMVALTPLEENKWKL